jgi:cytochrome c oxidase subunit 2
MNLSWKHTAMAAALAVFAFPGMAQQASSTQAAASPATTIEIHAKKFEFVPAEITLKKGVPAKLELTSDDVEHSLVVPGLKINGIMKKGEMTDVSVTPEETGDFPGRCGKYCGLGHKKMHFVVHVVN